MDSVGNTVKKELMLIMFKLSVQPLNFMWRDNWDNNLPLLYVTRGFLKLNCDWLPVKEECSSRASGIYQLCLWKHSFLPSDAHSAFYFPSDIIIAFSSQKN